MTKPVTDQALSDHLGGLPPVRIVYTDLDGTLLGSSGSLLHDGQGLPSSAGALALVHAFRAGVHVVAVSGRKAATLAQDVRLLGLDGAIAEVGSVIIRDGRHHFRWGRCPRGIAETPRQAIDAVGAPRLLLDTFDGDLRPYAPWDAGREGGHLFHGLIDVTRANQVLVDADIGWAKMVDNGATGGWPGRDDVRAYHLLARGVGKAVAVTEDLVARGLQPNQAMAIGDSAEDQTMASSVGTYVLVANSSGDPGNNAFRVTGHHGDGVAQAIAAAVTGRDLAN